MKRVEYRLRLEDKSPSGGMDARRRDARRPPEGDGTACHSAISPVPTSKPLSKRQLALAEKQVLTLNVWKNGNKIEAKPAPVKKPHPCESVRGKITILTAKVMRRLRRKLAEVQRGAVAYTFCLSYPDQFPDASVAREHFKKLQRYINWKHKEWGMFYKREPQQRGATHFHMLAFLGEDEELAKEIAHSILRKWCDITTGGDDKQLSVHLHDSNFQRMKGESFFNYLGKYIAKDSDKMPEGYANEGGGRWWGEVNKKSIPWAEMEEERIGKNDPKLQKQLMRIYYRLRQNRAQAAVDSLHFICKNVRLNAEDLFRAMIKKEEYKNLGVKHVRKLARLYTFKMEGSRRAVDAPIKANKMRKLGSVTLLGNPEPIMEAIERFLVPTIDKKARSRIFGENYKPVTKEDE